MAYVHEIVRTDAELHLLVDRLETPTLGIKALSRFEESGRGAQVQKAPAPWPPDYKPTFLPLGELMMRLRVGRANPGHWLPLRGKTRGSSGRALLADFAMRGFAISSLIPRRIASSDSLIEFLLAMIDDCTFLEP